MRVRRLEGALRASSKWRRRCLFQELGKQNRTQGMVCWGDFPGSPSPKHHKERSLGLPGCTVGEGREDFRCEG